jgi:hypothetical protein
MLDVKVGDKLRDCDPRSQGITKIVVKVEPDRVVVRLGNRETSLARIRIHNKPEKKSGYCLVRT